MADLTIAAPRRRAFLVAIIAGLGACEGAGTDDGGQAVSIAPGTSFVLPPPADLGRIVDAAQLIEAKQGTETIATFEGRLSVDRNRVLLVGTDMLGRRALTAEWNGQSLKAATADWLPRSFRVRNVIGDIVLLFWPAASLQRVLAPAGAVLDDGPARRSIRLGSRELVQIRYEPDQAHAWAGRAHYRNLAWGYELHVRSSEVGR